VFLGHPVPCLDFAVSIYLFYQYREFIRAAAASFNESTESIEQEQEQETDSPTETDPSVVNDVQAEAEDNTADDDDASLLPKPVLSR